MMNPKMMATQMDGCCSEGPACGSCDACCEATAGPGCRADIKAMPERAARAEAALRFPRIRSTRVLRNLNRRRFLDSICACPGMTLTALARELGVARVVALHHVRVLEAHGLICKAEHDGHWAYFPAGAGASSERARAMVAMKGPSRESIVRALCACDRGMTQKQLMECCGMSQRLVAYHLARMEECGLVCASGTMPAFYEPTPMCRELAESQLGVAGPCCNDPSADGATGNVCESPRC